MPNKNSFTQLGFVLKDLLPSQIAYLCITESNNWLKNNVNTNISIFYEEPTITCVPLTFARYHIRDTILFKGDLICTNFSSILATENATRANKFFYINDLEWIRPNFKYHSDINRIMFDESIIKFTRCNDYYNKLIEQGVKLHKKIVKDFDIQTIMEIINVR